MDTNKMREQFEAFWLNSEYHQGMGEASLVRVWLDDPESDYAITRTQYLWALWQASREAVVVELPARKIYESHVDTSNFKDGFNHCLSDARELIEAQGLKVAP